MRMAKEPCIILSWLSTSGWLSANLMENPNHALSSSQMRKPPPLWGIDWDSDQLESRSLRHALSNIEGFWRQWFYRFIFDLFRDLVEFTSHPSVNNTIVISLQDLLEIYPSNRLDKIRLRWLVFLVNKRWKYFCPIVTRIRLPEDYVGFTSVHLHNFLFAFSICFLLCFFLLCLLNDTNGVEKVSLKRGDRARFLIWILKFHKIIIFFW